MSENLAVRWMRRYKLFFLLGLLILGIQIFLAYKSLGIAELHSEQSSAVGLLNQVRYGGSSNSNSNSNSANDDEETPVAATILQQRRSAQRQAGTAAVALTAEQLGFEPACVIGAKEAISALQRAKTKDCKKHIAQVACAIQAGEFYPSHLPSYCPAGNYTANAPLGCYRDEKEFRLLSGYFTNFKTSNSPERCIQLCLQSGYPYAGVQYGSECFCGADVPASAAKLPDSSCNMKCSGSTKEACGGYFTMNIFETGIAKFTAKVAETSVKSDVERVKIAFLLTLNGRALRQVHRLIRALYSPQHVFFIHVDARQDYLYRKLLELEPEFRNIRLARKRFSTIWGGASLLTMLLQCMQDLLESSWHWDFVINLSESDFPVKTVDKLVDFLSANKMRNFVKSHGRETQRFIQKQGLDKTFVECDTHMWRIGDRQLPAGMQVDGGSDWVALSRPFVHYITREKESDLLQGLLKIFRHTLLPAESFFHTVLRNSRFCGSYVDNNLHVTNWKRKLGCKCQYKHVVDWCGCSPNDFKPDDWQRLQATEHKMLFFARKFEPIINQAIILQLEEWLFGPYTSEYVNLNAYWQSFYHIHDKYATADDLTRTIADSLLRLVGRKIKGAEAMQMQLLEITNFLSNDQYKGFLLHYRNTQIGNNSSSSRSIELETRIRPVQYQKLAKNAKFSKRLRNFEVSSDFDQKEQIARNFVKFLGPHTELVLSFTFAGATPQTHTAEPTGYTYNLTLLWIDPAGQLQDFIELHIEDSQTDAIHFSKATLKHPLTPGIWTVKLIGRSAIYAQTKFLVAPLAYQADAPISATRSQVVNLGSSLSHVPFKTPTEWQQHLPPAEDVRVLRQLVEANAQRSIAEVHSWVDELVGKFFQIRETCAVSVSTQISTEAVVTLPLCRDTAWSSLAPDPKSDISALLKRRRR